MNYKTDDLQSAIQDATAGQGVDRIIEVDLAVNINTDIAALRPNGEIVVYGSGAVEIKVPFSPAIRKGARITFFIVYSLDPYIRERAIADLAMLLKENRLSHNIAARLPLEKIAEAHDMVEEGRAIGNVVLQIE